MGRKLYEIQGSSSIMKGWWGPKHKTFVKIQAFMDQYPELDFRIVIRGGLPS